MTKPEKVPCTDPKEIHAQNLNLGLTKHKSAAATSRAAAATQPAAASALPPVPRSPSVSSPAMSVNLNLPRFR